MEDGRVPDARRPLREAQDAVLGRLGDEDGRLAGRERDRRRVREAAQRERPQQPRRALARDDEDGARAVVQPRVAVGARVGEEERTRGVEDDGARALRGAREGGAREGAGEGARKGNKLRSKS